MRPAFVSQVCLSCGEGRLGGVLLVKAVCVEFIGCEDRFCAFLSKYFLLGVMILLKSKSWVSKKIFVPNKPDLWKNNNGLSK